MWRSYLFEDDYDTETFRKEFIKLKPRGVDVSIDIFIFCALFSMQIMNEL